MKLQKYVWFVAGLALAGFVLPSTALAVDVAPVTGDSVPIAVGETRKVQIIRNGEEMWRMALRLSDNQLDVTRSDGCKFSRMIDDIYGSSSSWENCRKGPWGSGKSENISKKGQLWPLAVVNKVEYKFHAVNSKGKKNKKAFRKCEVTSTEMVKAGGKEYATYRIECEEHSGTRVFSYAPEVRATVLMERNHKKRGRSGWEYVKDL